MAKGHILPVVVLTAEVGPCGPKARRHAVTITSIDHWGCGLTLVASTCDPRELGQTVLLGVFHRTEQGQNPPHCAAWGSPTEQSKGETLHTVLLGVSHRIEQGQNPPIGVLCAEVRSSCLFADLNDTAPCLLTSLTSFPRCSVPFWAPSVLTGYLFLKSLHHHSAVYSTWWQEADSTLQDGNSSGLCVTLPLRDQEHVPRCKISFHFLLNHLRSTLWKKAESRCDVNEKSDQVTFPASCESCRGGVWMCCTAGSRTSRQSMLLSRVTVT